MMHFPGYLEAPRCEPGEVPVGERENFAEVTAGFDEPTARYEAQRCLSCGNCFECDICYASCPEQAITQPDRGLGYTVDLDHCSGCAVCFEQCPCQAIQMVPEPSGHPLPVGSLGELLAPSLFKVRP